MNQIDYSKFKAPPTYKCSVCGATGCKMWRKSHSSCIELHCASCAAQKEKEDISSIDKEGRHLGVFGETDQIGNYVPAVPCEGDFESVLESEFYGYTSVPEAGCLWWRNILTFPKIKLIKLLSRYDLMRLYGLVQEKK